MGTESNNCVFYTGKAWKHHVSKDFKNKKLLQCVNGAKKGATVFLDYHKMIDYLKADGRKWHAAELNLFSTKIEFNFKNKHMATILEDCISVKGFKAL